MSRKLTFSSNETIDCFSDMVEINLNGSCGLTTNPQPSVPIMDGLLKPPPALHRGYPYGYSDVEDATQTNSDLYFCKKSNSTGQLAEKVAGKQSQPATNISCLRQMYCPECHERLHEQGVRLERLLALCCFSLLPIYPCCVKRNSDDCKVICGKCGYLLGAWKRQ
ncbi:uncharacterized protein LOC115634510 [Scaptodrosophila lebanonensis]|uniref:Uncharacterized protein LOC115634510 n=1 Tax=Drosophila lebanonensis TaxID=7225 RepID=A0A6J2ULM4_DROLE|nr:uncharacterized protein LOC115634510 [Scaptodrosophila lebanonensis]